MSDEPKNLRRSPAQRRVKSRLAEFMPHLPEPELTQEELDAIAEHHATHSARAPEAEKPHPSHPTIEGISFWSYPGYKVCVSVYGVCLTFDDITAVRKFISWMAHMSFVAENEGMAP